MPEGPEASEEKNSLTEEYNSNEYNVSEIYVTDISQAKNPYTFQQFNHHHINPVE